MQRRSERSGRHRQAIAEATAAVDHGNSQVLGEPGVLQAVVHDDDGDGMRPRLDRMRPRSAIARDQRRHNSSEQQRLVADVTGHVGLGIHPIGPRQAPAVASGERHRLMPRCPHALAQMNGKRRLAGAAGREVANADDRQPRPIRPARVTITRSARIARSSSVQIEYSGIGAQSRR